MLSNTHAFCLPEHAIDKRYLPIYTRDSEWKVDDAACVSRPTVPFRGEMCHTKVEVPFRSRAVSART
jgi:hypothetical protein